MRDGHVIHKKKGSDNTMEQKRYWHLHVATVAAAVALSGCAGYYIDELDSARLDGMPFANHLAKEYETLAKRESNVYNDQIGATHFAVKGIQATTGLNVLPENPQHWDIPEKDMPRFLDGRERLTFALDNNGRVISPDIAARAQVMYDCAVEEADDGNCDISAKCWSGFQNALTHLEKSIQNQAPTFSIHFEMNSSVVSNASMHTLSEVARVAKNMPLRTVQITGHADGVGGRKHNLLLSQNRASAIRDVLVKMGVDAKRVVAVGAGEVNERASTKNRRADIQIH